MCSLAGGNGTGGALRWRLPCLPGSGSGVSCSSELAPRLGGCEDCQALAKGRALVRARNLQSCFSYSSLYKHIIVGIEHIAFPFHIPLCLNFAAMSTVLMISL